jgi:ribosome-associated heat shock protein Hsp15
MNEAVLRLDKWLWHARFCKSRTLAAKLATAGKVRVGGTLVFKAHHAVKPGDVLTFPLGPHIRTVKVLALGVPRAPEPPAAGARPTKADRRAIDRLQGGEDA